MRALAVHLLFFLSGISGLVYQVVWVRQFGNLFGNTVYSASIVSGVFLCGLGVGSWLTGRWIDRRWGGDARSPLRAYGGFELAIGALGLGIAVVLPLLEPLSASLSAYRTGPEGWQQLTWSSHALQYLVALALLAPITIPMGGTLTLLIRHLVTHDVSVAGWRIGVLYGINTAGAACGAFLTDFALVPQLGVFATEGVAVGLNASAGLGALCLARASRGGSPALPEAREVLPAGRPDQRRVAWTGVALFCSGLAAMGLQILWFRYLTGVLGSLRSVFSLQLTVILVGIWLGSMLGGFVHRRVGRAATLFVAVQTLTVVLALVHLAAFTKWHGGAVSPELAAQWREASALGRRGIETWLNLRPIVLLIGSPALLMGFAYPLANAHVQRSRSSVGGRAGALYLANTFGNVTGSLLTGFVLLPFVGIQNAVAVLAGFGALSVFALGRSVDDERERPTLRPVFAGSLLALALALAGWDQLPRDFLLAPSVPRGFAPGQKVLAVSEGVQETLAVLEVPGVERRLFTNGHSMSSSHRFAQRYMRLFVHVPLLRMDAPEDVLVICFGVGNTLHAASLYPSVQRIEAVDLSENVVRHGVWFADSNKLVQADPRVRIFINDGRQHLRMQPEESYDLITLEPPPIAYAGVASLYSREFYELARSRLKPQGALTQWLPAYQVDASATLSIVRAFLDVFPNAVLLSGYQSEFILLGARDGDNRIDVDEVRLRLKANHTVKTDLRHVDVETLTALLGTFVADAQTLEHATAGARPVTDDYPIMEYSVGARLFETRLPESIFDLAGVERWCPSCFPDGRPHRKLRRLPGYLKALSAWYASEAFLVHRSEAAARHRYEAEPPDDPQVYAAIRASRYLRRFMHVRPDPLLSARD